jgi:UDP-N-acetylmuramyl tripeptide synthase
MAYRPPKRSIRFLLTIFIVRLFRFGMRLIGHNATHYPGTVALKLCPDFLGRIGLPKKIIGITGTNGKTTVSNLIADLLRADGVRLVHNTMGSNIKEGVTTTMLEATTFFGKAKDVLLVLELDERATRVIFPDLLPDLLVVTNLFRESYLRNGNAEFIFRVLDEATPASVPLIVNADDLLSQQLARGRQAVSFGIAPYAAEEEEEINRINDVVLCPDCRSVLTYDFVRYHHFGRARCDRCGFRNMDADYLLTRTVKNDGRQSLVIRHGNDYELYPFIGEGRIDLYNELTAIVTMRELGYRMSTVGRLLGRTKLGESRQETEKVGSTLIHRMLAKGLNPVAVTRVIEATRRLPGKKAYILLNDTSVEANKAIENTAWIYDADLERLVDEDIVQVIVGGHRAKDYGVRLLFAGVKPERMTLLEDKEQTADVVLRHGLDHVFILYELYSDTAARRVMIRLREHLKR